MTLQSLRSSITEMPFDEALKLVLAVRESRTIRKKPTQRQKVAATKQKQKTSAALKNISADMAGDLLRLLGLEG